MSISARADAERRHRITPAGRSAADRHSGLVSGGRAAAVQRLQVLAGNRAVAALLAGRQPAVLQRSCACRPTCGCTDEEPSRATTTDPPVQRLAIQRFVVKPRLASSDLQDPRLQEAVGSAARALRVGETDEAVRKLQVAPGKVGPPVPPTGTYDDATQTAVAPFQASESIPFPTGRESGPKTLSSLDERLLRGTKPPSPRSDAMSTSRASGRRR